MRRSTRRIPYAGVLLLALAACNTGGESTGDVDPDPVFTPTQYTVADFYKNTGFANASWSPDGSKILVSANPTGIWNAYVVPAAGGEMQALTSSAADAVLTIDYFPADERLLYSSDQGGNELSHLYVRATDGTVKDLTPGDKHQANFISWAGDDKSMFVAMNDRDPSFFDVHQITTDGYRRTLLFRNPGGFDIGGVSPDGRFVLLTKTRTTNDSDLWLHDRQSKTTKNITTHTGNVNNFPADFAPDNSRLLFVSDSGREFAALRAYDLTTGATSTVFEQPWDVTGASFSKSGKYLVVTVNEDATSTQRLLDGKTLAAVSLTGAPTGLMTGLTVSRNDSAVAFYSSDGSVPNELYAARLGADPKRITNALHASIKREDLVKPRVVRFTSYDGTEIPGVLYRPHQASGTAQGPAIVLVHGGPGGQGIVAYSPLTQALVNHGYVVLDINNRGSSGYGKSFLAMDDRKHGEADLGDVVASKRLLIETGYVDSTKIGIMGGSYGGFMVLAALTLQPDEFKVGVDLFGVANWSRTLESVPPYWEAFREALYAEMGDPKTDSVRLHRISPVFHADKIKVPLMVLQGANDPRVLQVESDEIVAGARKNGVPVEYVVFPDEGHGFLKNENKIKGYSAVIAFLDKHLKGVAAQ
jgi:dipeptidyl aminopeptidase/acylaminoacyl peptidase